MRRAMTQRNCHTPRHDASASASSNSSSLHDARVSLTRSTDNEEAEGEEGEEGEKEGKGSIGESEKGGWKHRTR